MIAIARFLKLLLRLSGLGALLLGLAFWAGFAFSWQTVHVAFGMLLVVTLWATAVLAIRADTHRALAIVAFLWGTAVVAFGYEQAAILPGPMHWIVALAHLAAGGIAMGLGVVLAAAVERAISGEPEELAVADQR
ncbi:MAG: hypothetical protein WB812_00230 [Woeseiaceae bacterium]